MKYVMMLALCLLSLLLSGIVLRAEDTHPCKEDIATFCKDVRPGGGRIVRCLKEHEQELSAACRTHQEDLKKKTKEASQACHDDISQFCKDVRPGGGRIINCLKEHEAELSVECKEKVNQRKRR